MTLEQITALGGKITSFLALFADCFGRRDARELLRLPWLASKTSRTAKRAEKAGKRRATEAISTRGASPVVLRSSQSGHVFARISQAVMATVSHQGHGQRSRSLGDQMGHILAQGRGRLANSPSLSDRSSQCTDGRSEILLVEPCAGRKKSGQGQVRDVALVASRSIRSLVDRKLFSRGQRRVGLWIITKSAVGVACIDIFS